MKNNFFFWLVLLVILFNYNSLSSNELKINATEVNVDNVQKIIILKGDVNAEDDQNNKLFSPKFSAHRLLNVIDGVSAGDSGAILAWDGKTIPY